MNFGLSRLMFQWVCLLFCLFLSSVALAQDAALNQGLRLLFDGNGAPPNMQSQLQSARGFKMKLDHLIQSNELPEVTWTRVNSVTRKFEFQSSVLRPGHPANTVVGFVSEPKLPSGCEVTFPGTLIVHHIADDITPEKVMASMIARFRDGVTMVIFLPHYGPRRGEGQLITDNTAELEVNMLQSLADIHQAGLLLKSLKSVEARRLQLMGISLGGVLTLMSAGLDPLFDRYLSLVGGGDLAHILAKDFSSEPDSEIAQALKHLDWQQEEAREFISRFDPITWSYNVRNKSIVLLTAEKDEVIDREKSLDKLAKAYRDSGNKVETYFHPGGHRPKVSDLLKWKGLKNVVGPIARFIKTKKHADINACYALTEN